METDIAVQYLVCSGCDDGKRRAGYKVGACFKGNLEREEVQV